VVVVARHGDRNPKQKVKVEVRHPLFIKMFETFGLGIGVHWILAVIPLASSIGVGC
jgi:hypothetical protein